MQINITSAILGLMLASALLGAALGFTSAKAFLPERTVERTVGVELTSEQILAIGCYDLMETYFDAEDGSPAEDEAFQAQEDRGCWPF